MSGERRESDLVEQLLRVPEDGVRVVVLTGNGLAFCAGFDLKEIRELDRRGERFRPPMNRPARNSSRWSPRRRCR